VDARVHPFGCIRIDTEVDPYSRFRVLRRIWI
jgi:hypothetical protein